MTIIRSISSLNITNNNMSNNSSDILNNSSIDDTKINENDNQDKNKLSYDRPEPTYASLSSGLGCNIL